MTRPDLDAIEARLKAATSANDALDTVCRVSQMDSYDDTNDFADAVDTVNNYVDETKAAIEQMAAYIRDLEGRLPLLEAKAGVFDRLVQSPLLRVCFCWQGGYLRGSHSPTCLMPEIDRVRAIEQRAKGGG